MLLLCILEDYNIRILLLLQKCYWFSVACQQWTSQMNTNYANGQGNPATTIQMCQTACVANTGCNGVDWVTTASLGSQCWLSGTWSGARESTLGVTHYFLNRNCAGKLQDFDLSCIYVGTLWFIYLFYHNCWLLAFELITSCFQFCTERFPLFSVKVF